MGGLGDPLVPVMVCLWARRFPATPRRVCVQTRAGLQDRGFRTCSAEPGGLPRHDTGEIPTVTRLQRESNITSSPSYLKFPVRHLRAGDSAPQKFANPAGQRVPESCQL